ncbi:MAG: glycosyl hydrolase family 18 protein [Bryobacteraceae bacterium]
MNATRRQLLRLAALSGIVPLARAQTKPARLVLYAFNQLIGSTDSTRQMVEEVGESSFNVVILAFLNIRQSNGQAIFRYNDSPLAQLPKELPAHIQKLKSGFSAPKKVLISLGGWANQDDFRSIRAIGVEKFIGQLNSQVIRPLSLDGIDIDLEPAIESPEAWQSIYDELGRTIVDLSNRYKAANPEHVVTHAPTSGLTAGLYIKDGRLHGLAGSILESTRAASGNNIDWLNVQFYEGGAVKNETITSFYKDQLVAGLAAKSKSTGIDNPLDFLSPTFEPDFHQPLAFCQSTLRDLTQACRANGRLDSVGLWEYGQTKAHTRDWSQGLAGSLRS